RFTLPRPKLHSDDLDFSFSGLKTAVMMRLRQMQADAGEGGLDESAHADLAAATQQAIVDVLVGKSVKALRQTGLKRLVIAGGVGANKMLREKLSAKLSRLHAEAFFPPLALCTDNGAMIAFAAAMRIEAVLASMAVQDASFTV